MGEMIVAGPGKHILSYFVNQLYHHSKLPTTAHIACMKFEEGRLFSALQWWAAS